MPISEWQVATRLTLDQFHHLVPGPEHPPGPLRHPDHLAVPQRAVWVHE